MEDISHIATEAFLSVVRLGAIWKPIPMDVRQRTD